MTNNNGSVSTWTRVGDNTSSSRNKSGNFSINVSDGLPRHEESIKKPQNSLNRNQNSDFFANSIIRVFAGEPQRYAPEIRDQIRNQSLVDFFGRGLNAQGPAMNSNPALHRPYQSSQNQGSLFDFLGNPFGKPKTSISPESSSIIGKANYLYV